MNMKKIYKELAQKYGMSVSDIKNEIQEAINAAYINPIFNARCMPCKGETPDADEFIVYMARKCGFFQELHHSGFWKWPHLTFIHKFHELRLKLHK